MNFFRMLTVGGVAIFVVSCRSSNCANRFETDSVYVQVEVSGEVVQQGRVAIRRDFTKESFLEAVGGFTYGSNMGATPTFFRLKRDVNREVKQWEIRFDQMPKFKAKGFRFQDGDLVEVPRLLF